jgi:phosphomannomutase
VASAVDTIAIRAAQPAVEIVGGGEEEAEALLSELGCRRGGMRLELDADGDRMSAGDPEWTLPLAVLARGPRLVVRGADTSRMVDSLVPAVTTVPPGELHLVEGLEADGTRPALAGEGNGGLVLPELLLARDGLATAALLIELTARTGQTIEEHAARLPALSRRRSELELGPEPESALAAATRIPDAAAGAAGVEIERGDGLWGLVRRSATEPVLRVTVEGPEDAAVQALHAEVLEALTPPT